MHVIPKEGMGGYFNSTSLILRTIGFNKSSHLCRTFQYNILSTRYLWYVVCQSTHA